jgi:predicted RNA methylase
MLVAAMWLVALSATAGESPYSSNELTTAYGQAADYILDQTGFTNKGYCVVFGAGEGRLAYELAARGELNFIGVDEDADDVDAGRALLDDGDFYGTRITLHHGSLTNLP